MKTKIWIIGEELDDKLISEFEGFIQPKDIDYLSYKDRKYQIMHTELDLDNNTFNIFIDTAD
jgi:hypothetical protein